ncbi:queuosine salvage protein-like [Nylanderia fulva]|uniref:queuosine salvage protein-like n=1 Tax=Nylanderia fulva TaxID=613905 RepID=UPI0010FB4B40|nr:queuosine salvage protein-like [Nylanderia fulva]
MAEYNSSNDVMELSEAVKKISNNAQDVFVNKENIPKVAKIMMRHLLKNVKDFHAYNDRFVRPFAFLREFEDTKRANWLFVLHTLNFSLWHRRGSRQWKVNGEKGYFGLCNALKRATEEETPIWDPNYYAKITPDAFEDIFRSDDGETHIPRLKLRLMILHSIGKILLDKYQGTFLECIKSSDYDADKLMKLLSDEFSSYRDEIKYDGKRVRFLIKARSLVTDIWTYFNEKPEIKLNIKELMSTTFIDYRIPQVLLQSKLLRYSDDLTKRFEINIEPLLHESREEIEIRGCSLFVIQEICNELQRLSQHYIEQEPILKDLNISIVVDNILCALLFVGTINKSLNAYPLHCIETIYY